MYSYNNNMARFKQNMYPTTINYNDERFAGGSRRAAGNFKYQ